ncbi:hypothetical protein AB0C98_25255 [Streptomyces sp. NPDC048558]|uniref:hypothetical protein n=1 Tax=Streptomyces sp. NPDC048558 TaxID=3155759 RepID=UPI0034494319
MIQIAFSRPGSSRRVTVSPLANWLTVSTASIALLNRYTPMATPSTISTTVIAAAVAYQ